MNKQVFVALLRDRLSGLPQADIEDRVGFYSEMIDDRVEDGLSEEEAVGDIGSVDEVAEQIIADIPLAKIAKEKIKQRRKLRAWEIVLLVLGFPIWGSLLISLFAVIISLYAVVWAVIGSVWSVFGALVGCAVGGLAYGVIAICVESLVLGLVVIGAAIACAGLSIFAFFGCLAATKGLVWLTGRIVLGIKNLFLKKEGAR